MMFGVAAGLLVMALAVGFAMPELTQYYSQITRTATAGRVRLVGFGLVGSTILLACAAAWLALAITRGRSRTRVFSWTSCGATACGAIAVLVLRPAEAVPWLATVLEIAAAVVAVQSISIAVLLSQPQSGKFFGPRRGADHDRRTPPTPASSHGMAAAAFAPATTAEPPAPADYDPFS